MNKLKVGILVRVMIERFRIGEAVVRLNELERENGTTSGTAIALGALDSGCRLFLLDIDVAMPVRQDGPT